MFKKIFQKLTKLSHQKNSYQRQIRAEMLTAEREYTKIMVDQVRFNKISNITCSQAQPHSLTSKIGKANVRATNLNTKLSNQQNKTILHKTVRVTAL